MNGHSAIFCRDEQSLHQKASAEEKQISDSGSDRHPTGTASSLGNDGIEMGTASRTRYAAVKPSAH